MASVELGNGRRRPDVGGRRGRRYGATAPARQPCHARAPEVGVRPRKRSAAHRLGLLGSCNIVARCQPGPACPRRRVGRNKACEGMHAGQRSVFSVIDGWLSSNVTNQTCRRLVSIHQTLTIFRVWGAPCLLTLMAFLACFLHSGWFCAAIPAFLPCSCAFSCDSSADLLPDPGRVAPPGVITACAHRPVALG